MANCDHRPDFGRYLSPEPLLQNPNFVMTQAQQGLQTPAYAYAANNPLRYQDADGLRIRTTITVGPAAYGPTSCPDGSGGTYPGCTAATYPYVGITSTCYEGPPDPMCSGGSKGRWKFDVWMNILLTPQFHNAAAASFPSGDSPGRTLGEHEQLHIGDFQTSFSDPLVNQNVPTEGFSSKAACEVARAQFAATFSRYSSTIGAYSCITHDAHSCQ